MRLCSQGQLVLFGTLSDRDNRASIKVAFMIKTSVKSVIIELILNYYSFITTYGFLRSFLVPLQLLEKNTVHLLEKNTVHLQELSMKKHLALSIGNGTIIVLLML